MTGRGVDQILAHPVDPAIYEQWAKSATDYVVLAERRNGPIPFPVDPGYVWGDVLRFVTEREAATLVINLETAVTDRGEPWPSKGIHYRMSPRNLDCLTAAGVDICCLANNHTLDWSYEGLDQTLASLTDAGLAKSGAGEDRVDAWKPGTVSLVESDVSVLSLGMTSSGIPAEWAALVDKPGVATIGSNVDSSVELVGASWSRPDSGMFIVSIHWGPNWGYEIPDLHRRLARRLIDDARVDVVYGHSSHHPIGIEIYRGKPILYGCGDLINDYEGIRGHEEFRPDLRVVYLLDFDPNSGNVEELELAAFISRRLSLESAPREEVRWLAERLADQSRELGTRFEHTADGRLLVAL